MNFFYSSEKGWSSSCYLGSFTGKNIVEPSNVKKCSTPKWYKVSLPVFCDTVYFLNFMFGIRTCYLQLNIVG